MQKLSSIEEISRIFQEISTMEEIYCVVRNVGNVFLSAILLVIQDYLDYGIDIGDIHFTVLIDISCVGI